MANHVFEVRQSKIQGKGGFASAAIAKGEKIVEYIGDRISHKEASKRYDDEAMARHHTFLFTVSSRTCIDGNRKDNVARFINHSCDPNCEAVLDGSRVFIVAKRSIPAGTELNYDYAYEVDYDQKQAEAVYPCRCGARACRKTIALVAVKAAVKPKAKPKKALKKSGAQKTTAGTKKTTSKKATGKKVAR
jgi:uncharacterized protein